MIVKSFTCGHMLLQSAVIVAKKFAVDDKITACVKEICLWVSYANFRIEKHCQVTHFAFLAININFVLCITYCCFTSC